MTRFHAAHNISYAHAAKSRSGRAVIRLMENGTGRVGLIRRAKGYGDDVAGGRCFFEVMAERYGLELELTTGTLDLIPRTGPLVLIANHPYGILDGLMMGLLLSRTRGDFRILANAVFDQAEALQQVILPISFAQSRAGVALNMNTRKQALSYLGQGGAIGVFPGGTVSTGARPFSRPMDPGWRSFTARMVAKSDAVVVPVHFEGHTSRLFQIASHLHATLRLGLLIKEFRKRVDSQVRIGIGAPIPRDILDPMTTDAKGMMDFLRKATYDLAQDPIKRYDLGYDFEERHRS